MCVGVWVCGCVGVWVSGCVGVWMCGCVGVWVCGCVGVSVCGCVGVWVCGCVGVWVCGWVCVYVCGCVGVCECECAWVGGQSVVIKYKHNSFRAIVLISPIQYQVTTFATVCIFYLCLSASLHFVCHRKHVFYVFGVRPCIMSTS